MTDQEKRRVFDTLPGTSTYGAPGIPIHPHPGIFETTIVDEGPDSEWYLRSREKVFGDPQQMNDVITDRMLDAGWVPSEYGCLVKPGKAPNINVNRKVKKKP